MSGSHHFNIEIYSKYIEVHSQQHSTSSSSTLISIRRIHSSSQQHFTIEDRLSSPLASSSSTFASSSFASSSFASLTIWDFIPLHIEYRVELQQHSTTSADTITDRDPRSSIRTHIRLTTQRTRAQSKRTAWIPHRQATAVTNCRCVG